MLKGNFQTNGRFFFKNITSNVLFNLTHFLRNSDESVTTKSWAPTATTNSQFPFVGWNSNSYYSIAIIDIYYRSNFLRYKSLCFGADNNNLVPSFQCQAIGCYTGELKNGFGDIEINCGTNVYAELYRESM